ncbi:MAG: MotA/TolQ/ExbB proton channel family protein [Planctomycetia bacterium]|nr:MotA/TolQ/ExbB proton channel family protein [Planctomycetia bacterium]
MAKRWIVATVVIAVAVLAAGNVALAQESNEEVAKTSFWDIITISMSTVIGFMDIAAIFLCSIAAVALIVEHALTIRRTVLIPELGVAQIKTMFDERRFREALTFCQNDPSFVSKVVHAGLVEAAHGYGAMEKGMTDAAEDQTSRLFRKIEYLNLIGNISPMLGLFGTVYGMMEAFSVIASSGGRAEPAQLAGGILTALFSTFFGLFVAIPALAGYAIFRNRVDQLSAEAAVISEELIAGFRPSAAAKKS